MLYTLYYKTGFGLGARKFHAASVKDAIGVAKIFAERNVSKSFSLFAEGTEEAVFTRGGDNE